MTIIEFFDPLADKKITYSISPVLKPKWEKLKSKVIKDNSDRVYIVTGKERSGKSFWTFQQAKFIDPTFNIDRICFTSEQFLEQIRTASKSSVVVFDEAFRGFSTRASLTKMNRLLVQSMMEVGKRNLIIFIVLPVFSLLEYYMAMNRSYALFVTYKTKDKGKKAGYRGWRCYSERKKAEIYYKSKKNYGMIPFVKTRMKGQFFCKTITLNNEAIKVPYETFPILEYEKKKDEAFAGKKGDFGFEDESKMTRQRRIFLVNWFLEMKRLNSIPLVSFLKRLDEIDCTIEHSNFAHLMEKTRKEGKVLGE